MRLEIKRIASNNFEIFVINNGKIIKRLGNILWLNGVKQFRMDFELLKYFLKNGVKIGGKIKKQLANLFFIL
jgi:hypothetical protein